MTTNAVSVELRLRQASLEDIGSICDFYENNPHQYLPIPTTKDIAEAIELGRLLVIAGNTGDIRACGAIFRYSPSNSKSYVGELAGMRSLLNGLRPISAQTLLIAARLLGHAATEAEAGPGRTNSLITIVKDGNDRSKRNIEAAGFVLLTERPRWFIYDQLAWNGTIDPKEWSYYYATHDTVAQMAHLLVDNGLYTSEFNLHRTDRNGNIIENVRVYSELSDITRALADITRMLNGEYKVDLCPPPTSLVF